jgi:hypothetical protein
MMKDLMRNERACIDFISPRAENDEGCDAASEDKHPKVQDYERVQR